MRLDAEADQLATRFEQAFWMEDRRYYAMALDRDKHQADAIASNAGQCLWSGIVTPDRAGDVVDRLLRPEMFSGWGVRTYASDQPGYNPIGYHTGTVWPHDTSLIAAGFKRYGFHDATNRLVGQMMEAAQGFADYRLPELFCGFDRTDANTPVPYPGRLLAAGVGGRIVIPVPRDDARTARARRPTRARTTSPAPARLARQGHADRSAHRGRVGRPAVPPLAGYDQRRGPAQGRRRRRHHPTLIAPAMTATRALVEAGTERLRAAGSDTPRLDAELLLAYAIGVDRTAVIAHGDAPVGADATAMYEALLARRETGEPVAYLRGIKEFHGIALTVDARALIPRPETELLVDTAIAAVMAALTSGIDRPGLLRVADVGTGSGAVAVALAVALTRQARPAGRPRHRRAGRVRGRPRPGA